MNKIYAILITMICCTFVSCSNDEWDNGDPAQEHVYFFGFENWGQTTALFNKNAVVYNVDRGATLEIPVQFHSERVRSYDAVVYYYVSSATGEMQRGVDYQIVDASGTVLNPDANGAFSITFSQAKKEVKNVYVKALNAGTGSFNVQTFDPNGGAISYPDNIINNKTNEYEVRAFTTNYKVKVTIK